uniref:Uncharacterized protein n=1 Tax=Panagrolaimus sp. ES5 TaxID=591445 RepID=A0AC34GWB1_9BILA
MAKHGNEYVEYGKIDDHELTALTSSRVIGREQPLQEKNHFCISRLPLNELVDASEKIDVEDECEEVGAKILLRIRCFRTSRFDFDEPPFFTAAPPSDFVGFPA